MKSAAELVKMGKKVDALGAINAEIAELKKKATKLKDELIEFGEAEVFGKTFKAVVIPKAAKTLDTKLVKSFLTLDEIAACTKVVESVSVSLFDL